MQTVAVVDYGSSNLRSVAKALEVVADGQSVIVVSSDPEQIRNADRVVFPGQGAIGDCMANMQALGLDQAVLEAIKDKPFLGICLGLQSLLEGSDEDGGVTGMGLIPGRVVRFRPELSSSGTRLKIPHMGWNQVQPTRDHQLFNGISPGSRFYFVHSYYVQPTNHDVVAATTDYGVTFASALAQDNLFATQFHPEKSARDGLTLLRNFLNWE